MGRLMHRSRQRRCVDRKVTPADPPKRASMRRVSVVFVVLALAACSTPSRSPSRADKTTTPLATPTSAAIPASSMLESSSVLIDGLNGPTQFLVLPDGTLLVAQLNGDENAKTGQVVTADPITGAVQVLVDNLDKPTGVTLLDGSLWIMERRELSRIPWTDADSPLGEPRVVLSNLPYNGRSSGTLTPLNASTLLYNTSGELAGSIDTGRVTPGSGTLFALDTRTLQSRAIATGTKHAYGHWVLSSNRLLTTEVLDGPGVHPSDELNLVDPTTVPDLGWPKCPSDLPTKQGCETYAPPLARFPPDSTPTGVVATQDDAYVALFSLGTIVRVPMTGWNPDDATVPYSIVANDLQGPHTFVIAPDGRLLVSEHFTGRILAFNL